MNTVVLLGTTHSIQRGERAANEFGAILVEECKKYHVKAIAEEAHNDSQTVASMSTPGLPKEHLYADPDSSERHERGIETDCRLDIVEKYQDQYPEIAMWPQEPSAESLPVEVWEEYSERTNKSHRMRERVWLEKIIRFNKWPLLFICGANHFKEFSKLLGASGYHVIESYEDWTPNESIESGFKT